MAAKLRGVDPVSQAVLGAAAAQAFVGHRLGRKTWWLGALGGMAPDLDVVIRNASDPLLAIEMHRNFTHSLAFIPIGGLLVAAPFSLWFSRRPDSNPEQLELIAAATTIGWATHGLLDAFTSYGTMLWWPFTRTRVAIDWISVIDPIYTLILAAGVALAARSLTRKPAIVALLLSTLYLGLCGLQHHRALLAQAQIAELRGHTMVRTKAHPLLLTNMLWRSMYETADGRIHIDALTVPWSRAVDHHGGDVRAKIHVPTPADDPGSRDLARFAWFADDWLYAAPDLQIEGSLDEVYCDARYSLAPAGFDGVFCLALGSEGATALIQRRPDDSGAAMREMVEMLKRKSAE